MKILIPKNKYVLDPELPLFFFCGPVRGAEDWQRKGVEILNKKLDGKFQVAIPYYYGDNVNFPLVLQAEKGDGNEFGRQLEWERFYIDVAGTGGENKNIKGCVVFFLPEESKTDPREGGHYANDTLGEIARASVHKKFNPDYRVVVGAEEGFYNLNQMQRNWDADQGKSEPFYPTLEQTLEEAIKLATY